MKGDGNGWAAGPHGSTLWGRFGAAGLMLVARRERTVLMQHRALWTHHGGTWALPGGARDSHETATDAALREAHEETAIDATSLRVVGEYLTAGPFPGDPERPDLAEQWSYTTVLAETHSGCSLSSQPNEESAELRWVHVDEVENLSLLPAFASAWPRLRREIVARLWRD
ncbi:NUDIX domain-containing protein [Corynebacterium lowii]|uniref:Putative Nudix hydrolase NudL n=1 Tax=Corynebacterium lowii TaxID=1544413 RepID=A0A0Q0YHN7_9CORY|nr:NUDIX domain-containing protein [Corynebacterium lowii]KQB86151.1 putative Nudix hydrolase NudL [Corynebacterium lowii]MDP9852626.1 8-oxo-dGTP diphosphatase [Corynebacterium lowii]